MKKIIIAINTSWNILNFRAGLVRRLVADGYEVVAVAPHDDYSLQLSDLGCRYIPIAMNRNGTNPIHDLALLRSYYRILREERPHAFLSYTIKPNVYGSLAAHALGIPVVNNVAGLGATFIRNNLLTKIVRGLYKLALKRSHKVFFQNAEDCNLFVNSGLVKRSSTAVIPGSGLNLEHYMPLASAELAGRRFRFLLVARMLLDKGIEEFVQAARILRQQGFLVDFHLLGPIDTENPNSVSTGLIKSWENEGLVTYLGRTDDVRDFLASADCVVLPSYREGVPRSLLEAAAMARPIITTDVAGCRDAVHDKVTGFLCEAKNPVSLAEKMRDMLLLTEDQRAALGAAGRRKIEIEFDEKIVIQQYVFALEFLGRSSLRINEVSELVSDIVNP